MPWNAIRPAEDIQHDIERDEGLRALYDERKQFAAYWMEHFSDDPKEVSGWGHHYVCHDCTGRLTYDREKPHEHYCEHCGKYFDSPDIYRAWIEARRNEILAGLNAAALAWRVEGDEAYRVFILRVLGWYADHYFEFEEHGTQVGMGRLGSHTLAEAIWGIQAVKAMFTAEIDPECPEAQHIKKGLLVPIVRTVMAQPTQLMNISLWHFACVMGVGAFYRDAWLLRPFIFYERSGTKLLLDNITEDGFWRENSAGYHYYALSAAMEFYCFLKQAEFPDGPYKARVLEAFHAGGKLEQQLIKAFAAPLRLMFPNGDLPATSDGWKYSLSDYQSYYYLACRMFPDAPEREAFAAIVHAKGKPDPSLNALLYGVPEPSDYDLFKLETVHLTHNKMAVLRSGETSVFFKYGNLCDGHSHPDALELGIFPFAVDPGSLSYGAPIHGEYFFVGGSHSTFMIDAQNMKRAACGTAELSSDGKHMRAEVLDAYPGVAASREVDLNGYVILDEMIVRCEEEHQIDWLFHGSGAFTSNGSLASAELPEKENGFKHFENVQLWTGERLKGSWSFEGKTLEIELEPLDEGAELYLADTPDNPTTLKRKALLIRKQGRTLAVRARFTVK